jgi:thiol-disulfide isomerase/thioredoxin
MRLDAIHRKWAVLGLLVLISVLFAGCAQKKAYEFSENDDQGKVVLYFFWGDGCPHCAAAKPVLLTINEKYPDLDIRAFEVWYKKPNQALYTQMADRLQVPDVGRGVPLLILGDKYWVGWNDATAEKIQAEIDVCLKDGCPDAGAGIMPGAPTATSNNGEPAGQVP